MASITAHTFLIILLSQPHSKAMRLAFLGYKRLLGLRTCFPMANIYCCAFTSLVLRVLGKRRDVVQTVDLIPNWTECRGVPTTEASGIPANPPEHTARRGNPHGGSLVQAYAHALVNGSIAERRSNKSGGWPLSKAISGLVEKLIMGHPFLGQQPYTIFVLAVETGTAV